MKRQNIKERASRLVRAIKSHNERTREQWMNRLESPRTNYLLRTQDQPLTASMKTVVF